MSGCDHHAQHKIQIKPKKVDRRIPLISEKQW